MLLWKQYFDWFICENVDVESSFDANNFILNLLTQSVTMYINMMQFDIKESFRNNKNSNRLSIVAFNVCKWCLKNNNFKKTILSHFNINSYEYCKQFCFSWIDCDCFLLACFLINHIIKKLKTIFLRVITRF